ncbi:hypothetical protein DRJ22_01005 [Candidatus Woesearchaeota archaeon]|nr:MAG: hypothetical protein B6U93_01645 [Candidatus Woesearchaeota archaeon ex4484_78]RLE46779.1 MAG: hypothetical protein DRJ22_01005 [Candidatus Woesearchaeota archaeon]
MVYEPQEDSLLLKSVAEQFAKGKVLDMGTGTGIQATTASRLEKVKEVIGVDADKKAIEYCKKKYKKEKIKWIQSDLFTALKKYRHYFDTIIFNPPYLPQEQKKRHTDLEGGKKGYETIKRFLYEVNYYLKENGTILLLFSSHTKKQKIKEFTEKVLLNHEEIAKKRLFFEELYVYKLTKSNLLKKLEKRKIERICFLAKGKRGKVYTGQYKGKKVAIKIKRAESKAKKTIEKEAKWMKFFNKFKIGPKYYFHTKEFLVYEFIEGTYFKDVIKKGKTSQIKKCLREILRQCYTMDKQEAAKEEMTRPLKNAIVSKNKIVLIDFERCHKTKNPHNVTQCSDFIYRLSKYRFKLDRKKFLKSVKEYAENKNKKNFEKIIALLK